MKKLIAAALAALCACTSAAPIARDQILESAYEYAFLRWYCDTYNIYSGVTNARCPYSSPGWQTGTSYKWGGEDTRDSFWTNVVVNHGWAGDTNSAAIVDTASGPWGDDCSGFASNILRSGRRTTSTFPPICTVRTYSNIGPGDLTNLASSHVRVYDKFTGTNLHQVFECTTGVSPGRTVRRIISRNNDYTPLRYNSTVAWPSLVRVQANGASSALVEFLGSADTGFRIYRSTDLTNWTRVVDTGTLGPLAQSATVSGLSADTTYYFTVRGVNSGGETDASCILPVRISSGARKALIVNGFDRWVNKSESAGKPHTFLPRYAAALAPAGYAFDSVDNLRVLDQTVAMGGYACVWWMLGDESTTDEALSQQEQLRIQDYLAAGGKLFISGAELLWDIGNKANQINDRSFVTNYLYADYGSDGASGNGYGFTGAAATPFANVGGSFDNGSGGTYNVLYPDVLTARTGASVVMRYGTGTVAATMRQGTFGAGSTPGTVIVCGFPFETITTAANRQAVVSAATTAFFGGSAVQDWSLY